MDPRVSSGFASLACAPEDDEAVMFPANRRGLRKARIDCGAN
jgi:hypothetical protein